MKMAELLTFPKKVYTFNDLKIYASTLFRLNETDFMEFSEVENHDDFYTLDDGRIHVQDQRGYYIVYQAACEDLEWVEFVL